MAYIEARNKDEEIPILTASEIKINWVYNNSSGEKQPLVLEIQSVSLPDKNKISYFGYVAAEFTTVKEIRQYLRKEKGWNREELNAYAYWKYGKSKNVSESERQEEKKSIDHL